MFDLLWEREEQMEEEILLLFKYGKGRAKGKSKIYFINFII